jgi:hypothetical protein
MIEGSRDGIVTGIKRGATEMANFIDVVNDVGE